MSKNYYRKPKPRPVEHTAVKKEESENMTADELEDIEVISAIDPNPIPIETVVAEAKVLFTVRVTSPALRKRSIPSFDGEIVGFIYGQGKFKIYAKEGKWGQIEDGSWIYLDYTVKCED